MALLEEARSAVQPCRGIFRGLNDPTRAARSEPPQTTVDDMNREKGRIAARLVLERGPPA